MKYIVFQVLLEKEAKLDDHKHGEMDITEQQRIFNGFIKFGIYVGLFSVFVLIFLALFNS